MSVSLPMRRIHAQRHTGGFSLIELLVVLTLIAVLASLAWPSLRGSVERAERTQAAACLLQLGAWIERIERQGYDDGGVDLRSSGLGCTETLAASYVFKFGVPSAGTWSFVRADAQRWQLLAQRRGLNSQATRQCQGLIYRDTGSRGVLKADGGVELGVEARRRCWR